MDERAEIFEVECGVVCDLLNMWDRMRHAVTCAPHGYELDAEKDKMKQITNVVWYGVRKGEVESVKVN